MAAAISISHPDRAALRSVAKTDCRQDVSERDDGRPGRPGSGAKVPLVRELDPSAGPLQFFGAELRRARTAAGLSQDQLGQRLGYSGAQVGKVETGERAPAQDFAEACDRAFPDTGGLFGRLYQLARRWDGGYPSWFAEWIDSERRAIHAGLRSPNAFTLRRAQILLQSADGRPPAQIADSLGCATQTVRNAIRAFQAAGIDSLEQRSHRPASAHPELDGIACERLRALLHRSPRDFGKPTSLWTLELIAHVAFAQGITARLMSGESVRQALVRMGIGWKRAKRSASSAKATGRVLMATSRPMEGSRARNTTPMAPRPSSPRI